MNANHVELWRRLEQFQLDAPEASLPFSARLARENQWSAGYTRRVITEYKRFAFLAVVAGHPVSPSEDVDQAWHLHLTYSESYWKVFGPEVLQQPLHHQPTRGGVEERLKFQDWYARTLASYEQHFGKPAPADIWPSPEARARENHNFVRVDRERHWVLPKPRLPAPGLRGLAFGLIPLAALCSGARFAEPWNPLNWRGPDFLGFYVLLFSICFGLAIWWRRALRLPAADGSRSMPELDGYATALLNGGPVLAVNTAVANLIRQKAMRVDSRQARLTSLVPRPEFDHELEAAVYAAANSTDGVPIGEVRSICEPVVEATKLPLVQAGLLVADAAGRRAQWRPLGLALAPVLVGIIKIGVGLSRERPVLILVGLCLCTGVLALAVLARRPRRSRHGDAVLRALRARHHALQSPPRNTSILQGADFALLLGLFGMSALADTDLRDLRWALQPPAGDGIGGFGAAGCGGGGCGGGGGGGGCGGCGGGGD